MVLADILLEVAVAHRNKLAAVAADSADNKNRPAVLVDQPHSNKEAVLECTVERS